MVQNILIDLWITSQAGVWGVCPPTNRKYTIFAWNLDTKKNSRLAEPADYYYFFTLTWNPGYAHVSYKHIVEKYSVWENHEKFNPETIATYLIFVKFGFIDIGPNMKLILTRMLGIMYINEAL